VGFQSCLFTERKRKREKVPLFILKNEVGKDTSGQKTQVVKKKTQVVKERTQVVRKKTQVVKERSHVERQNDFNRRQWQPKIANRPN
jgi:hypothetical protein